MLKLGAKELRVRRPTPDELSSIKRRPIYIVLDNVLDTYNIGGLFRLADATACEKVILCGQTETPPSSRIHKAAVGTEEWVPWQYEKEARTAISNLKSQTSNLNVIVVEQAEGSISYTEVGRYITSDDSIAIVVGHETEGVSQNIVSLADAVLEIPMFGVNKSLNVIVSAAIVLYKIIEEMDID